MGELLKELSQGQAVDRGPEERRATLLELLKVAREDSLVVWEEHFKTMLLLLLETLGDKDVSTYSPAESCFRFCSASGSDSCVSLSTQSGLCPCES